MRLETSSRRAFLAALCLAVLIAAPASAQLSTGSLTGVIQDPSGAVIPGVELTLIDAAKGYRYTATSDSVGRYLFRALQPSVYALKAEVPGFRVAQIENITITVAQNATADVTMVVGSATESIKVEASAPLLAAEDAEIGQTINRKLINDLPLVGRQIFDLAFLAPGVNFVNQPTSVFAGGNNFISNGSRNSTAEILDDGVALTNHNNQYANIMYTPAVDSVQEFKVEQGNFSAEYGAGAATVINVVGRSGTNQFHGAAFEFLRNDVLEANNYFAKAAGVQLAHTTWNNFGGTIGGPIRKDKTFFFFSFEGQRVGQGVNESMGVPSAAERAGDFSEICAPGFDSAGMCRDSESQLWDPYTSVFDAGQNGPVRQGYIPFNNLARYQSPGNPLIASVYPLAAAPGNAIDPVAAKMIQWFPQPNVQVGQPNYNRYNNWIGNGVNTTSFNNPEVRIDHRFNDANLLSVKVADQHKLFHLANFFGGVGDGHTQGPETDVNEKISASFTHMFGPTMLLNVSAGVSRFAPWSKGAVGEAPNFNPVKDLGLPSYILDSGIPSAPTVYVNGGYGANVGTQSWSYLKWGEESHHLLATLSKTLGRHDLKFGGEYRENKQNFFQGGATAGIENYDFNTTSQAPWSGGGDAMAGFLIGAAGPGAWGGYDIAQAPATANTQWGGFVQDNWRVSEKLTLNIGMRWDLDLPLTERFNHMSYLDMSAASPLQAPGVDLKGGLQFVTADHRSPYGANYHNFAPRFGIAYKAAPGLVLRGGYGVFFTINQTGASSNGYNGYSASSTFQQFYADTKAVPWGLLRNEFPYGVAQPTGSSLGMLTQIGLAIGGPYAPWGKTTPYEQSFSLGVQRQIGQSLVVDVSYVGRKGTHLYYGGANNLNYLPSAIGDNFARNADQYLAVVSNPFFGRITDPSSSLANPTVQAYQLLLPYPQFGTVSSATEAPRADSIYHSLQVRVEKRFSHGLQAVGSYTWSKSIDDASLSGTNYGWLGGAASLQNPNNLSAERSLSQFDTPHIVQFAYVYELPLGKGRPLLSHLHPVLEAIVGGWQTGGNWRFTSGFPLGITETGGQAIPTWGQYPTLTGKLLRAEPFNLTQYFANPEAVSVSAPYTLGNAPRTLSTLRSPGFQNVSAALFKDFSLAKIHEGAKLQFRAEMFNVFNHVQFAAANTTVGDPQFGATTSQANNPRDFQGGMKFEF